MTRSATVAALLAAASLAGCSLAPGYRRPSTPGLNGAGATVWKTAAGWRPAQPADGALRADWWTGFADPVLDDLVARADAHNQTLAGAAATYRQARAVTREARASLFPTISATGAVTHSQSGGGGGATTGANGTIISGGGASSTNYRVTGDASWQPDLFGRIGNTVRQARYTAEARLADLANARLAIQGELATDYLSLRASDALLASLTATVEAYRRSLTIATNRYNAGVVARTDVFQGESQLASAQAELEGQRRVRTQYEDAVAVLVGDNPAAFTLAPAAAWVPAVPTVPATLPSALVERRPDIAAAERATAAANASIGIERAAFFPTLNLSANGGFANNALSGLFGAASSFWSAGASLAQTIFDFGARSARVAQARAAYDAAVANYRQVALTALGEVQDNLIAQDVLARQEALLRTASAAADRSEASIRDRYRAGIVPFTDVVTAQATALNARRALIQGQLDRQNAAVALVQALGGGWSAADLANGAEAARAATIDAGQGR